ncbi:uncharacterized protein LOC114916537 [Cajanus cajan]|uniref:uncharacterized protein LOC114916537 n=1 Tax=Cajanus cajan TaxID=3821 RepID=UPI0010FAF14B|nr:uncharacterized protein LOC114916537 [Cajanus cajan]
MLVVDATTIMEVVISMVVDSRCNNNGLNSLGGRQRKEWRDFKYPSRNIKFAYGLESPDCSVGKYVSTINLPPFSSASIPEHDMQKEQLGEAEAQECRDFVMNVGGSVWALDWCPRIHEKPDCSIKCEFIAVAAHPPGSSYHKMGAPLTGRGVIQIWCLLNIREHNDKSTPKTRPKGRPRKNPAAVDDMNCDKKDGGTNDKSTQIKRPKGRPIKNPTKTPYLYDTSTKIA